MAITFLTYAHKKFYVESDRMQRYDRMENIEKLPAHHYSNRGGVLIRKEFVGFEKYHKNNESLMRWYKQAFPQIFENEPEPTATSTQH